MMKELTETEARELYLEGLKIASLGAIEKSSGFCSNACWDLRLVITMT